MSLAQIVGALWRRKFLIVAISVAGAALGYLVADMVPPQYVAEGVIVLRPAPRLDGEPEVQNVPAELVVGTQRDVIASREMLQQALDRTQIPAELASPRAALGRLAVIRDWIPLGGDEPTPEEIADWRLFTVSRGLEVEVNEDSFALVVRQTSPSAAFSADFVNVLIATYIEARTERARADKAALLRGLAESRQEIRTELDEVSRALDALAVRPNADIELRVAQQRGEGLQSVEQTLAAEFERVSGRSLDPGVTLVSEAAVPLRPAGSRKPFIMLAALLMSGGAAAAATVASASRPTRPRAQARRPETPSRSRRSRKAIR